MGIDLWQKEPAAGGASHHLVLRDLPRAKDVALASRTFDVRRAPGWFVAGVGPWNATEARGSLATLEILEFSAVKPDAEAHPTEIQTDAASTFLTHLA